MTHLLIALQFLTILPIKIRHELKKSDFGKALLYFPFAGLLLGLALSLVSFLSAFLPELIRAAIILIVSIVITGGIHLDGFADTCDGFYGTKSKEKVLEIMKDSRIGVMGVAGLICLLLLKFALIAEMPNTILWRALILMTVFARWIQVLACYKSNYVRKEGKAKYFIAYNSRNELLIGGIFTIILFLLLMGMAGLMLFVISLVPVLLFIKYSNKKIGGMTGDTIGAVSEIAESYVLFLTLVLTRLCI